jgi:hypothetical protein
MRLGMGGVPISPLYGCGGLIVQGGQTPGLRYYGIASSIWEGRRRSGKPCQSHMCTGLSVDSW